MSRSPLRLAVLVLLAASPLAAELPPVPFPPENPFSEAKRVLGKILFWDEQLSSDDSVACGTCHRPAAGGADPRRGLNPGREPGSQDDVAGSPGIRRLSHAGQPEPDPVFDTGPQITARVAPSIFGALWASEIFWDGRAGGEFIDPESGATVIAAGGALENQVVTTLASSIEMARPGRSWSELADRLAEAEPLALADHWPPDLVAAIARDHDYPSLFTAAFGDAQISAARIAMAIATYERTLVPDQTPYDRYRDGDSSALSGLAGFGLAALESLRCTQCHVPPLFTSNEFANIGLRRSEFDAGRAAVTGQADDNGAMKIPSLRNAALRPRLMHTGQFGSLAEAIGFYRDRSALPDLDTLPDGSSYAFSLNQLSIGDVFAFISEALTDPRVAAEQFPFDRPRLQSER